MQTKVTIAAILIVFAVFAFFAWQHTKSDLRIPEGVHGYESDIYRFSFEAPARYDIKTYTDQSIAIGERTGDGGFKSVSEVIIIEAGDDPYLSFMAYIESQLTNMCAADGPEQSRSCTAVVSSEPFTAEGGLPGTKYVLMEETRTLADDSVTEREVGPFYVFDLSAENPDKDLVALVVRVPMAESLPGSEEVTNSVAASVETRTYRSGMPSEESPAEAAQQ